MRWLLLVKIQKPYFNLCIHEHNILQNHRTNWHNQQHYAHKLDDSDRIIVMRWACQMDFCNYQVRSHSAKLLLWSKTIAIQNRNHTQDNSAGANLHTCTRIGSRGRASESRRRAGDDRGSSEGEGQRRSAMAQGLVRQRGPQQLGRVGTRQVCLWRARGGARQVGWPRANCLWGWRRCRSNRRWKKP